MAVAILAAVIAGAFGLDFLVVDFVEELLLTKDFFVIAIVPSPRIEINNLHIPDTLTQKYILPTFMVDLNAVASFAEPIPEAFGLDFLVVFFELLLLTRDFFVTAMVFPPIEIFCEI